MMVVCLMGHSIYKSVKGKEMKKELLLDEEIIFFNHGSRPMMVQTERVANRDRKDGHAS